MIVAVALSAFGWLIFGALGVPVDPFLPLAAAVALGTGWPAGWRALGVVTLAPLATAACVDDLGQRAAIYALAALLASQSDRLVRDGVGARVTLVLAALGTVVALRSALAFFGGPPPVQGVGAIALTLVWTGVHAGLCTWLERKP